MPQGKNSTHTAAIIPPADSFCFDVDGTLWDSTEEVARVWKKTCRLAGLPSSHITAERLKQEFGKLLEEIAVSLFPDTPEKERNAVLKDCLELENAALLRNPPPLYPGVREVFSALKERNVPVFIISNCQAGYIEVLLETHRLGDYVTGHLCPGDTGAAKAENIRLIKERFGLRSPCYIGDTDGDRRAAQSAGVPFIYASYGFGTVTGADFEITEPSGLLQLPLFS